MKKIKTLLAIYLLLPLTAFAQGKITGPVDTEGEVITVFERIANWIYTFFLIAAVICILLAAFKFLGIGGGGGKKDAPTSIQEGKRMLLYAVIAIAIALFAGYAPNVIENSLIGGSSQTGGSPSTNGSQGNPFNQDPQHGNTPALEPSAAF
ncbi:MAG: hypothetical protein Q8Q32_01295 [bacterium]|nr:hypothetical protein [bacterium]